MATPCAASLWRNVRRCETSLPFSRIFTCALTMPLHLLREARRGASLTCRWSPMVVRAWDAIADSGNPANETSGPRMPITHDHLRRKLGHCRLGYCVSPATNAFASKQYVVHGHRFFVVVNESLVTKGDVAITPTGDPLERSAAQCHGLGGQQAGQLCWHGGHAEADAALQGRGEDRHRSANVPVVTFKPGKDDEKALL